VTKAGKLLIVSLARRRRLTLAPDATRRISQLSAKQQRKSASLLALAERHGGVAPPDDLVLLHIKRDFATNETLAIAGMQKSRAMLPGSLHDRNVS
jgi:hypothetical protein